MVAEFKRDLDAYEEMFYQALRRHAANKPEFRLAKKPEKS
jgi:hypothetical protein